MLKQFTTDIAEEVGFAHRMLGDKRAGWYIGTFGAIGEFQCVEGDPEPVTASLEAGGQVTTARGGIRVVIDGNVRPIAYEGLSKRPDAWTLGAAFCLPTVEQQ